MGDLNLKAASGGQIVLTPTNTASNFTLTLPAKTGNIITSADTGTVTQTMLGTNVAGNGPAFQAYNNGTTTSVSAATFTKITLNAKYYDTNTNFDAVTNYRFTPTIAGYYLINAGVSAFGTSNVTSNVSLLLYKNGSISASGSAVTTMSGGWIAPTISQFIQMNGSSDYLELWIWGSAAITYAGSTAPNLFGAGSVSAYMNGFLARSA